MNGDFYVTYDKIKDVIKNLKRKKSPGIDGISNRMLKALPKKGIQSLTNIINNCLKFSYFPDCWKEAKVIAICKPNKISSCPLSYRPISLLSSLSKILEKIVKEKILKHCDECNVFP